MLLVIALHNSVRMQCVLVVFHVPLWNMYLKLSKLARKGREEVKHYDILRTVRFFCFGCMISGCK